MMITLAFYLPFSTLEATPYNKNTTRDLHISLHWTTSFQSLLYYVDKVESEVITIYMLTALNIVYLKDAISLENI